MDEQHAIALLKQGDLTGLEFLVRQYQAKAVHTAYLIIGDTSLAEDIVQTAFLRVAQKIDQFDAQRSFQPWFLRMWSMMPSKPRIARNGGFVGRIIRCHDQLVDGQNPQARRTGRSQ